MDPKTIDDCFLDGQKSYWEIEYEKMMAERNQIQAELDILRNQLGKSVLPMLIDHGDGTTEEIFCPQMSGGADSINGMPKRLTLIRQHGNNRKYGEYILVLPIRTTRYTR